MQAITYQDLGKVQFSSIAEPEPAAHEVVIRVRASGICHTDIDILYGRYGNSTFPIVPGHEYAGEVVGIGEAVTAFSSGDRVVVDPNFHCGQCRSCVRGLTNLCDQLGAYGVTKNGGFADYSVVNEGNVVPIGELEYGVAALAEPLGCVLNGVDVAGTRNVNSALVFGAGPIGMLMALALRSRDIADICVVDIDESRLRLAESFGFRALVNDSDDLLPFQREVDLVVDATGIPSVAQTLIRYACNGGCMLMFGVCPPEATISISPHEIFRRQLRITGAHSLNHNIPQALDTIQKIGPDIARLISHRLPVGDIAEFLEKKPQHDTLKVQACWSDA